MNLLRSPTAPHCIAWVCCACLTIVTMAAGANPVQAGVPSPAYSVTVSNITASAPPVAAFWDSIRGDRRRMIQVGIVAVCLGFFLLSWSRK